MSRFINALSVNANFHKMVTLIFGEWELHFWRKWIPVKTILIFLTMISEKSKKFRNSKFRSWIFSSFIFLRNKSSNSKRGHLTRTQAYEIHCFGYEKSIYWQKRCLDFAKLLFLSMGKPETLSQKINFNFSLLGFEFWKKLFNQWTSGKYFLLAVVQSWQKHFHF